MCLKYETKSKVNRRNEMHLKHIHYSSTGGRNGNKTWLGSAYKDGNALTEVLEYDAEADKWNLVGELSVARNRHAISKVPGWVPDYCV